MCSTGTIKSTRPEEMALAGIPSCCGAVPSWPCAMVRPPRSLIALTPSVPVEHMAEKMLSYVARFKRLDSQVAYGRQSDAERTENARRAICGHLLRHMRHDFRGYKENTFLRRVQRRMQVLQLDTLEAYADRLENDHDEAAALFRDLLIGVTSFFRDVPVFDLLQERVIPALFENRGAHDTIRV